VLVLLVKILKSNHFFYEIAKQTHHNISLPSFSSITISVSSRTTVTNVIDAVMILAAPVPLGSIVTARLTFPSAWLRIDERHDANGDEKNDDEQAHFLLSKR